MIQFVGCTAPAAAAAAPTEHPMHACSTRSLAVAGGTTGDEALNLIEGGGRTPACVSVCVSVTEHQLAVLVERWMDEKGVLLL